MPEKWIQYWRLARLDKPVGWLLLLWPTLWALWIASDGHPHPGIVVIFVLGVITMRAAGCVINDIFDRDLDPLIEDSEVLAVQAATSRAEGLKAELPELRIALLHGRIPPGEKDEIMEAFRSGKVDVLVATTVIEVGVDVPEASLMVIENAERLGLSQLHQLRGRVGRGDRQSVCVLMYQGPLGSTAKERLATLRQTTDGFAIAQKDLELRGPGELLGTRQSGAPQFRIADLARDRALLPAVQRAATGLLRDHPEQAAPLVARWLRAGLAFSHA